jgi:hypothetical protein
MAVSGLAVGETHPDRGAPEFSWEFFSTTHSAQEYIVYLFYKSLRDWQGLDEIQAQSRCRDIPFDFCNVFV